MISSALPIGPLEPALAAVADAPPVAQDDALAAHETALISGNLFDDHGNGADEDPEGGALRVVAVQGVASHVGLGLNLSAGRVRVMENGKFWFDTAGDFGYLIGGETVEISFDYTIADAAGATSTATATVTVTGANNAPTLYPDFLYTNETAVLSGNVFAFNGVGADKDPEGAALRVVDFMGGAARAGTSATLPEGGVVRLDADGKIWFRADGAYDHLKVGELEEVTFTYRATDGQFTRTSHVTLMIEGRNTAPDARDDAFAVLEDGTRHGYLLADNGAGPDTDIEGDSLLVYAVNQDKAKVGVSFDLAEGGRVRVLETGEFWFNPDHDFDHLKSGESETVSFTYTVSDDHGGYDRATVEIEVQGFSYQSVVAVDDVLTVPENTARGYNFVDNDYESAADEPEVISVSFAPGGPGDYAGPIGGVLTLREDTQIFDFDPEDDFDFLQKNETASFDFTYTIEDRNGDRSDATVTVTVRGENDAPIALDDHFVWSLSGGNPVMNVLADNGEGADYDIETGGTIDVTRFKPENFSLTRGAGAEVNLSGGGTASIAIDGVVTIGAVSEGDYYTEGGELEAGDQVVLDYWIADQHDLEGPPAQAFIDIIA